MRIVVKVMESKRGVQCECPHCDSSSRGGCVSVCHGHDVSQHGELIRGVKKNRTDPQDRHRTQRAAHDTAQLKHNTSKIQHAESRSELLPENKAHLSVSMAARFYVGTFLRKHVITSARYYVTAFFYAQRGSVKNNSINN